MSSFTEPLTVTKIGNRIWKVERPFRYYVGSEGSDKFVDVPKGFTTDFASVPRIFWTIFPPDGKYTQAAVVHDFLYHIQIYSRKESDAIFLEAMQVLGVSWWKRRTMWLAVRVGAGWIWKNHKKELEKSNLSSL